MERLFDEAGELNHDLIATLAAVTGQAVPLSLPAELVRARAGLRGA